MVEHVQQRWPENDEIMDILEDIKFGTPILFEMARDRFEEEVDPEAYHQEAPTAGDMIMCNMAFSEYTLFDFDLGGGMTPLLRAAMRDLSLSDFARSQFYSLFWVLEQNWEEGTARLRDMATREDFTVHDAHLARNARWSEGTLGTRLACVDGEWRFAGQVHLHDNAPSVPQPRDPKAPGCGICDPELFLRHVQQVIGHSGIYRDCSVHLDMLDRLDDEDE